MKIRKEMMESFAEESIAKSRDKIVKRFTKFADEIHYQDDNQLNEFCSRGIQNAAKYDIRIEHNVFVFIVCMLLYGENFDSMPPENEWSHEILSETVVDEDVRTKALEFRIACDKGKRV